MQQHFRGDHLELRRGPRRGPRLHLGGDGTAGIVALFPPAIEMARSLQVELAVKRHWRAETAAIQRHMAKNFALLLSWPDYVESSRRPRLRFRSEERRVGEECRS